MNLAPGLKSDISTEKKKSKKKIEDRKILFIFIHLVISFYQKIMWPITIVVTLFSTLRNAADCLQSKYSDNKIFYILSLMP